MATIATLFVKLGLDTSAYSAGLASAANKAAGFAKNVGASSIAAGKALSLGLTAPILAAGVGSLIAAADFERTTIAFTTMLGSAEDAHKLLNDLAVFGVKTPFTLPEVEAGAKGLLAYGIELDDILPTMKALGDVSAGLNVPMSRMVLNFGQVKAQAKLTGRELRDFAILGVPLIAELAKNLGVAESEIQGMVSAGDIGFDLVNEAFMTMTSEGGKFNDLMAEMNKTTSGQFAEMKDEIIILARAIGKELLPVANDLIAWAKGLIEKFTAMSPEQQKQVMMWAGIVAAIGPALIIFGALANIVAFLIPIFAAVGAVLTGPVLLAIVAIIAIVAALRLAWVSNFAGIQDSFKFWVDVIRQVFDAFKVGFSGDWETMGVMLVDIWKNTWVVINQALKDGAARIAEFIGGFINGVVASFKNVDWSAVGSAIINGIDSGIRAAGKNLIASVIRIAKAAIAAMKRALGISSPSKVFAEMGKFSAEGFGMGFDKAIPGVVGGISAVVSGVTVSNANSSKPGEQSLFEAIASLGDRIEDMTVQTVNAISMRAL